MFYVCSKRCNECLMSDRKIVADARRDEILKQCAAEDRHFLCHKGTIVDREIACRGFYDAFPAVGRMRRIAELLRVVRETEQPMETKTHAITIRRPQGSNLLPDNSSYTNRFEVRSQSSDAIYLVAQSKTGRWWSCSCFGWIRHRRCKHLTAMGLPGQQQPFEAKLAEGSRR